MTRGKRLAALEQAAEQARAARVAAFEETLRRAVQATPGDAVKSVQEWMELSERDPERARAIHESVSAVARPLDHPAKEAALAWAEQLDATPEDGQLPPAPAGTAAFFTAEAADWERALHDEASSTPDMQTAARWYAGLYRYRACLARELGDPEPDDCGVYGREQENFAWLLLFKLPHAMARHVRSLGDGPGIEQLYNGYRQVRRNFPPGEVSGAVAAEAYRAAFEGEQ